ERIAQPILQGQGRESFDERLVQRAMNIDPPDSAARLAGVEEGAVHQILDRMSEIRVLADIGRIIAAELETNGNEAIGGGPLDRRAAGHRSSERDATEAAVADETLRIRVRQMQHLKEARRQARLHKAFGEALRGERRLRRVFEENGVAGHDGGDDTVEGDQEGLVPGSDG